MVQFWVATALLTGFIVAMKLGLQHVLSSWGFGPYMAVCIGGGLFFIAAAFAYDYATARAPRPPPRELNDRPPSMK